jgi:hypothetical protein
VPDYDGTEELAMVPRTPSLRFKDTLHVEALAPGDASELSFPNNLEGVFEAETKVSKPASILQLEDTAFPRPGSSYPRKS